MTTIEQWRAVAEFVDKATRPNSALDKRIATLAGWQRSLDAANDDAEY